MLTRLQTDLEEAAQRKVDTAMVVAFLIGTFSLVVALRTWNSRIYIDLETLLGTVDALLILLLAVLLARGWRPATYVLLVLAIFGMGFTVWRGLPLQAIVPPLATAIVYVRAISAQRYLMRNETADHPVT